MTESKKAPLIGILSCKVTEECGRIVARGKCVMKFLGGGERIDTKELKVEVPFNDKAFQISFKTRYGKPLPKGINLNSFELSVDIDGAKKLDVQNKIIATYKGYQGRILYNAFDLKKGHNRNSRIFMHDGLAMYFRQSRYNTLNFTVREANQYDTEEGQRRIEAARRNAKGYRDKDIILMYEKNCMRYEESASVLYEKLIDRGYDNAYFIVDTSISAVQNIDEKYKNNLIEKDSDKHLEYFFACKKFISSETMDHALQLRIANKSVQDKINGEDLSYVFLQHGVMYMVSLNSKLRVGFKQRSKYKLHKTVVSSEAEAQHFINLAGMSEKNLYITGLAKFDTSYMNDDADKIIIMPTWRRWETNQAKDDLENTGYYRMLERMYYAVPENMRDKVVILPHPLIAEMFKDEHTLDKHIVMADSYDALMRDCRLLITDYSSIAYDAFYRGANVVFDWSELDECMEHYGEGTHLMLNDSNVFGKVCKNESDLKNAIEYSYGKNQSEQEIKRFRRIVEFHDGKNSERIIRELQKDGMISIKGDEQ